MFHVFLHIFFSALQQETVMGILGLTTFMDNNTWIFEKVNLHDTKVVIDGNNLYHFIFF